MTIQQLKAVRLVCDGILEAVESAGHNGAPSGILYAALSAQGCSMVQFQGLMAGLVKAGFLRRDGDCYVSTGREIPGRPVAAPDVYVDAWTRAARGQL